MMFSAESIPTTQSVIKQHNLRSILREYSVHCWNSAFFIKITAILFSIISLKNLNTEYEFARISVMILGTFCLLLHYPMHRYAFFKQNSLFLLHFSIFFPIALELLLFGSIEGRNLYHFLFISHFILSLVLVQNKAKALMMGGITFFVFIASIAIWPQNTQLNGSLGWYIMLILIPSAAEGLLSLLFDRLECKDQKLLEIAVQYETGMRMLSHDLANLLEVSKANLELTLEEIEENKGNINQAGLSYLDETRCSLHQCGAMLGAVRDYVSYMNGKKSPSQDSFNLTHATKSAIQSWQRQARRKNISLVLTNHVIHSETLIHGSEALFVHTILGNLLANSIKISPVNGEINLVIDKLPTSNQIVLDLLGSGQFFEEDIVTANMLSVGKVGEDAKRQDLGLGFGMPLVKQTLVLFRGHIETQVQAEPSNEKSVVEAKPKLHFRITLNQTHSHSSQNNSAEGVTKRSA